MNRKTKMEKYLKFFAEIYQSNPTIDINIDTIYHYLVIDKETKNKIKPFHQKWIENFKTVPNIDVFVSKKDPYFCQFVSPNFQVEERSEIKIYIPVDSEHIDLAANDIFRFLALHGIRHSSKIGSDERRDNIVIRLENRKDLPLLQEFIHNNQNIRKGCIETNPFIISDGMIGYASDRSLGYTGVVSQYIKNYLQQKRSKNELDKVSLSDFFQYCSNLYQNTFMNGNHETILEYMNLFNFSNIKTRNEMIDLLNNYQEISFLLITAMQTNDIQFFYDHIEEINNPEKVAEEKRSLLAKWNKMGNQIHSDEPDTKITNIINHSVEDTIQKQCPSLSLSEFQSIKKECLLLGIHEILKNQNYTYFTSTNNARNNMKMIGPDALKVELIKGAFLTYCISNNQQSSNYNQVIKFIINTFKQKGASQAYQLVCEYPDIQESLIENYATLLTTTTKEERKKIMDIYSPQFQNQLKTLNNLQNFLVNSNQEKSQLKESQSQY